ncbi:PREDICTED: MHC class I polypeptide-related sequence B-like [Condylura cristata]|uniref:MHC class I polypeptide-related sequence B-like n=1 Tax=Condylura cristata TaxID=143302 RepID=UPI0006431813|nr:PREDICTED: MHC class I polypeptide-related sequence B-like [Condylura cristata]XP_012590070.1 PREDICTED: MHC class I polypeptide-related sequence B-like [Condylura cristata]
MLQAELTVTQDAALPSTFVAKGYLYHPLQLCHDREKESGVAPRGLLVRVVLGAEPGPRVAMASGFAGDGHDLRMKLAFIRGKLSEEGGSHSLQEIRGCETQEDTTTSAFRWFLYNGEPFLFYDETTQEWGAPPSSFHALAMEVKISWDTESIENRNSWARVLGELCGDLRRFRDSWLAFIGSTGVKATCSRASEDAASMTCRALSISPWNISLVRLEDDEPLSPDVQLPGGPAVLTYENGTYCDGVALRVPPGEAQRGTSSMGHSGNHTVTSGDPGERRRGISGHWLAVAAVLFTLI